jgi:hypothetical protein
MTSLFLTFHIFGPTLFEPTTMYYSAASSSETPRRRCVTGFGYSEFAFAPDFTNLSGTPPVIDV